MAGDDGTDGASGGGTSRTVFLSYASHDTEIANTVCRELESRGIRCWIAPRDVAPGALYADAIVRAINEAKVLLIVLSQSAVASSHVGKEVERASSKHKQIIALRIDAAPLTPALEYFLSESQWVDIPALGMQAALGKIADVIRAGPASGTSDAARGTPGTTASPAPNKGRSPLTIGILVAVGLITVVGCLFLANHLHWFSHEDAATTSAVPPETSTAQTVLSEKSIAVLPFTDMSEKHDQEYFSDGMAEEIIDLLVKVPELKVPAQTSSFYFKGKTVKVADIARELGVVHVLEGSIRRSGNRLRVTAQLVRADTGYHVWSETYDRDLSDVFKVQDDIANAVVQALQISLMGGPLTRQKGGTQNLDAYLLLLRSDKELSDFSAASLKEARKHTEQAIKLDPDFILAWNMLGWINVNLAQLRELSVRDGYERARATGQHALQLSADIADAHLLLGYIHRTYDFDWGAAQIEAHRGLALEPKYWYSLEFNGQVAASIGDWVGAERYYRQVLAVDPLNPQPHWDLGTALYHSGRFPAAEAEYRKLIELSPEYSWAHGYLAMTLVAEGKLEAALAAAEQERDEANRLDILPIVLHAVGRVAEADEALRVLTSTFADTDAYYIAMNYAYRGDHDLALQWLERAYKQREPGFVEIVGEPLFKSLAGDPQFKAFLRKMNLPE
jgi:TolB-like protein